MEGRSCKSGRRLGHFNNSKTSKFRDGLYTARSKNEGYSQPTFYPMYILRNSHYTTVSELFAPRKVPLYEQLYLNELEKIRHLDKYAVKAVRKPQCITLLKSTGVRFKPGTSVPSLKIQTLSPGIGNLKTLREDLRKTKGDPVKRSTIAVNVNFVKKIVFKKISE